MFDNNKKDKSLRVRFTDEEMKYIEYQSNTLNISKSELVRNALVSYFKNWGNH